MSFGDDSIPMDLTGDAMDIPFRQVGALPYRVTLTGEVEVLLVTSRGTGQWIVPKGWPMEGLTDPEAAAREAYEEAGVSGDIEALPFGSYLYEKPAKDTDILSPFVVEIYPLRVKRQLTFWPEHGQRRTAWFTLGLALEMISNDMLAQLIAVFAARTDLS